MTTNTIKFINLAKQSGLVGIPSGWGFEGTLKAIEAKNFESMRFEFGRKGQTIARLYWADKDYRGDVVGGCISVIG